MFYHAHRSDCHHAAQFAIAATHLFSLKAGDTSWHIMTIVGAYLENPPLSLPRLVTLCMSHCTSLLIAEAQTQGSNFTPYLVSTIMCIMYVLLQVASDLFQPDLGHSMLDLVQSTYHTRLACAEKHSIPAGTGAELQAGLGKLWAATAQSALNDAIGYLCLFAARNAAP